MSKVDNGAIAAEIRNLADKIYVEMERPIRESFGALKERTVVDLTNTSYKLAVKILSAKSKGLVK